MAEEVVADVDVQPQEGCGHAGRRAPPAPALSLSLPGLALSAAPAPADDEPAKPKKAARPARRNFMAGVVRAAGERASGKKLTEDSLSEAIRGFISYAVFLFHLRRRLLLDALV